MNDLQTVLYETHYRAAMDRPCASSQILKGVYESNGGNLVAAITAAMQTFGGKHAPIKDTYEWLLFVKTKLNGLDMAIKMVYDRIVPGFGSSFVRGKFDPLLEPIDNNLFDLRIQWRDTWKRMSNAFFETRRHNLYPNLAFYTAAVAIETNTPIEFCEEIMLRARLEAWINLLKNKT